MLAPLGIRATLTLQLGQLTSTHSSVVKLKFLCPHTTGAGGQLRSHQLCLLTSGRAEETGSRPRVPRLVGAVSFRRDL